MAPVDNVIVNNDINASEFIIIDNDNNIIENNLNRREIKMKALMYGVILLGLPAVTFFISCLIRRSKPQSDK